jgi:ethanolamine utilization microcompartment shell protein EutL
MDVRIIESPSAGMVDMLKKRSKTLREAENFDYDSVGLVQGKVADMFVAADAAEKAANVMVFEVNGVCPQHYTMLVVMGRTSAVKSAINTVKYEVEHCKKMSEK